MFDVGFSELCLILLLALLVLGPERLPQVARTTGRWIGNARRLFSTLQSELEKEVDGARAGVDNLRSTTQLPKNPLQDEMQSLKQAWQTEPTDAASPSATQSANADHIAVASSITENIDVEQSRVEKAE